MNCPNCGSPVKDQSRFCSSCGSNIEKQTSAQPVADPNASRFSANSAGQPVGYSPPSAGHPHRAPEHPYNTGGQRYQTPPPASHQASQTPYQAPPPSAYPPPQYGYQAPQSAYAGVPMYPAPKKKKRIGLWIFLLLLFGAIGAAIWLIGNLSFFGPKNLGVKYTEKDYNEAIEKTGVSVSFDGKSGKALEDYKKSLKDEKLNIDDYNWEFSDYQQKQFTLTSSEASALLDNIAPDFWWFENTQVKAYPDGTIEGSSSIDLSVILSELAISNVEIELDGRSLPLPKKLNIYIKGKLTITNNKLKVIPEKFAIGPVTIPDKHMTPDVVEEMEDFFSHIYTIIPGLKVNSLTTDKNGNFVFDGVVPQSVRVSPKK